jgi:uncharacterized DUF497 family protein
MSDRLIFHFDPQKTASNRAKHGVTFAKAMTVFSDSPASTLPDEMHSSMRSASLPLAYRQDSEFYSSFPLKTSPASGSSIPALPLQQRSNNMKKSVESGPLAPRPGMDFSQGARGKHLARMQEGTNVILLAPDLLESFPGSDAVNSALRSLKAIAARTTKLPKVYSPARTQSMRAQTPAPPAHRRRGSAPAHPSPRPCARWV